MFGRDVPAQGFIGPGRLRQDISTQDVSTQGISGQDTCRHGGAVSLVLVRDRAEHLGWPVGWFPVLVFALVVASGG